MINKSDIIQDLKSLGAKIGHKPSFRDYKNNGKYAIQSVINHFVTWNKAIEECLKELPPKPKIEKKKVSCKTCGKETTNKKYCCHSCAAKDTNKSHYKPEIHTFCKACSKEIFKRSIFCRKCYMENSIKEYGEKTLGSFRKIKASKNRYQAVRNHAHQIAEFYNLRPSKCHLCNYNNHLDLCHIEDIYSFSDDTKLKVINDAKNLIFLCPNHHWDLGHGKLNKNIIRSGAPREV